MTSLYDRTQEAATFLRDNGATPRALAVLGTGLGDGLGNKLELRTTIPYEDIPHFPRSTSPGHAGSLVLGWRGEAQIMIMQGRFHYYEGYSLEEVTLPIRVARALGCETLLITSAVGGMNPRYRMGEIVAIDDHIHLIPDNPLRGENDERLGPRFPDMSAPYDASLLDRAEALAHEAGDRLPRAVLAAVSGPQLETRAEYRFLRALGADVVGMSMTPEVLVAVHAGMKVCGLSVVTDLCFPDSLEAVDVDAIIATANEAAPRLERLLNGLLDHV